jgi:hypothetical protein
VWKSLAPSLRSRIAGGADKKGPDVGEAYKRRRPPTEKGAKTKAPTHQASEARQERSLFQRLCAHISALSVTELYSSFHHMEFEAPATNWFPSILSMTGARARPSHGMQNVGSHFQSRAYRRSMCMPTRFQDNASTSPFNMAPGRFDRYAKRHTWSRSRALFRLPSRPSNHYTRTIE